MRRVQLALNVTDIDEAVSFYERLFATPVAKRKPGYANFEIAEPPLKLVLIAGSDGGTLNHLGIEVDSAEDVATVDLRLQKLGLASTGVDDTTCCYATKTETWVSDPDGAPWEWYVKTGDTESYTGTTSEGRACCAPESAQPVTIR